MKFLAALFHGLAALLIYGCVATTVAEGIGLSALWSQGGLSATKIRKYAAVMYGFDVTALDFGDKQRPDHAAETTMSREEMLQARVDADAKLVARKQAIKKGADDIRGRAQRLSTKRERYEIVKQGFSELLGQLEQDARTAAIQEVRRTLEAVRPKQAKDLLMDMLQDNQVASSDDVLGDVLAIIRGMPQDKLKKVFGEFKTDTERNELHRVLVAIGELDQR